MTLYFITNSANDATNLPFMESALGHSNIFIRHSLDNSLSIFKFDTTNLPPGINEGDGLTNSEIRVYIDSIEWTETPSSENEGNI